MIKEDETDECTQDMYIYEDLPVIARKTVKQGDVCMNNETFDWDKMDTKCRYTALSRARKPEQVSFGKVNLLFEIKSFETNIQNKISGHLKYDKEKKSKSDISVEKVKSIISKEKCRLQYLWLCHENYKLKIK